MTPFLEDAGWLDLRHRSNPRRSLDVDADDHIDQQIFLILNQQIDTGSLLQMIFRYSVMQDSDPKN